jgi:predicted Zn-dependent protease
LSTTDDGSGPVLSRASLLAAAAAAAASGDHERALLRWGEARDRFPDAVPAWLHASELLIRLRRFPEAEALLAAAVRRFPGNFWLARTRASLFRHLGDQVEAYTQARALLHAFPDDPTAHADLVQLLLNQKRVGAAEAEARSGLARFPDLRWLHHSYARCADLTGDNQAAATRWTELLMRHPDHEPAYTGAVHALIAEGRPDEAAGIARAGQRLLPNSAAVREACDSIDTARPAAATAAAPLIESPIDLLAGALRAESASQWEEAARLWDALCTQVPTFARAYAGATRALCRCGRMAEAEIVLAAARRDLPADASVLQTWADAAAERGDLASALLRLRTLRKAFPDAAGVDLAIARTLRALGHLDEADAAFGALAKRYPADLGVVQEFASVASERSNVSEAIRRWTSVIAAFPDHVAGYWRLADALVRAERLSDADALLCDAAGRFRDDLETGLRWAMSGRATGDASRFDALCRRFPELAPLLA